jgi:hypothetical protein
MTMTTPRPEVEPPLPPPRGGIPVRRFCFSGDGRMTSRRWAPGGDTRYRERLRNAYANNRMVPDPWVIAEHGGREDRLPEGWDAWPAVSPMSVAQRLDAERVNADPYADASHWQDWLTFTARKQAERAQARENVADRPSAHRTRTEREAAEQMQRPRRHARGWAVLDPDEPTGERERVQVVDLADRYRLLVSKLDDPSDPRQYLVFDTQFDPESESSIPDLDARDSGEGSTTGHMDR